MRGDGEERIFTRVRFLGIIEGRVYDVERSLGESGMLPVKRTIKNNKFFVVSHAMGGRYFMLLLYIAHDFHWCHYMQFPLKSLVVVVIYVISYRSNQRASVIKTLFIIHFSF